VGSSKGRLGRHNQAGLDRHQSLVQAVQSHVTALGRTAWVLIALDH
jgi:hypothetical protein